MNWTRAVITFAESFGMLGAIYLAVEVHWFIGYIAASTMMVIAWIEGHEGWGSYKAPSR